MLGKAEIRGILEKRFENDIHTKISEIPLPNCLKDVYKAAFRIKTAIENNEKMVIVGDYDVDGIVSCVILSEFLRLLGADYEVRIPNRFTDGYGINPEIIDEFNDANLIITVDNGISAVEAGEECLKKGIDLIITDHHMPPAVLPKAYAIVNPKQKECKFPNIEICGAQVAWYLVGALKEVCNVKYDMSSVLDLLILAIIADMMELRDMNRVLVKMGLKKLNSSKRVCFRAIRKYLAKELFEFDDVGFLIAPLINSSGRMDDASVSFKFLSSKDIRQAEQYLEQIDKFNKLRKEKERFLYENSLGDISENDHVIVVWGENWHEGVIGIVASRLAKSYKRPAIVFSIEGDKVKGSGRSIGKFDLLNLVAMHENLLINYGGHKGAVGIMIEKERLNEFKNAINSNPVTNEIPKNDYEDELLGEIKIDEFDNEMLEILEFFEPYGQKNPKPIFKISGAKIIQSRTIGRDNNHLKLVIEKNGAHKDALFFNFSRILEVGESVDLIVSVTKNVFKGTITPEFVIKEVI